MSTTVNPMDLSGRTVIVTGAAQGIDQAIARLEKMTSSQWLDVMEVNLTGCYLMMQAAGRHMLSRSSQGVPQPAGTTGSIVNISSTGAKRGSFGQANYAAAKSGLFGLNMTGAVEWARYGISALEAVGVPCAPVNNIKELAESEQLAAVDILQNLPENGIRVVGLPISFDRQRPRSARPAPGLGEHNAEVFDELLSV